MEKTILIHCTPFDRYIDVLVLDKKTQTIVDREPVVIDNLPEVIFKLSDKHDCSTLNIKGFKMYTKGIEKKIKEAELTKYNANHLRINLVK